MRRLLLALAFASCVTAAPAGAAPFRVDCNVPEAAVYIDDVYVGRASEWASDGRFIRPGAHRVELRHPSYFSHYAELRVDERQGGVVKAELHALLD